MPIAVLPSGQNRFVQRTLDVSVALRDPETRATIERMIREALRDDPRQLSVRLQGDGGFGAWTFWIVWGMGADQKSTRPVVLPDNEHTPEAVVSRIKAELEALEKSQPH